MSQYILGEMKDGYGSTPGDGSTLDLITYNTGTAALGGALNGAVFAVETTVVAYDATNHKGLGSTLLGYFRIESGTVTQIGSTTVTETDDLTGAVGANPAYVVSSANVIVRVTGNSVATIYWRARSRITVYQPL